MENWINSVKYHINRSKIPFIIIGAIVVMTIGGFLLWGLPSAYGINHASAAAAAEPAVPNRTAGANSHSRAQTSSRLSEIQANLSLKVSHVQSMTQDMTKFTNQEKGYVANIQFTQSSHAQNQAYMTLRIPQSLLPRTLTHFESLGKLINFSQTGVDVTRQYQNLTMQKATLTVEMTGYQTLFKKAGSMKDMLEIQRALTQVQAQLQQTDQNTAQLMHNVNYASLNITLVPALIPPRPSSHGFIGALATSLKMMQHVGYFSLLVLGWATPWLIVLALVGWGARSFKRVWGERRAAKSP